MAGKKKVLMVLTSNNKLGEVDEQTGWYLPELCHPHHVFEKSGMVDMVMASPEGGEAPVDEGSIDASKDDEICMQLWNDAGFKERVGSTTKLSDVSADDFDGLLIVGGYGVMWDLPDSEPLQKLISGIYEKGGVIGAVCHGPAGLVNVKLSSGEFLIKDKKVAGFTDDEEVQAGRKDKVPFTCEQKSMERGAVYTKRGPWQAHVVADGRLVTGQNPQSATGVAATMLGVFFGASC